MSGYKSYEPLWKYKLLEVKDHILSPYCFQALVTYIVIYIQYMFAEENY